jgi:anti-sigma factor RsiW
MSRLSRAQRLLMHQGPQLMSQTEHDNLLLNAALDGELDTASSINLQVSLEADPILAGEYGNLVALRKSIHANIARESAPDNLRERIANLTRSSRALRSKPRAFNGGVVSWRRMAASILAVAVLGPSAYTSLRSVSDSEIAGDVVAGQMRALVSGRAVDVESSDRHTVKPWLAGKAPLATAAVDLTDRGFPLLGGRIDIVKGAAVPTLVYKRREHLISVTELNLILIKYPSEPKRGASESYGTLAWSDGERSYIAVSDVAVTDFNTFVEAFREAVKQQDSENAK